MSQVIIFKKDSGDVSVFHPSPEALQKYSIDLIASVAVPPGKPYKVIDGSELPGRESRQAWEVLDADLTDGIGAEWNTIDEVRA